METLKFLFKTNGYVSPPSNWKIKIDLQLFIHLRRHSHKHCFLCSTFFCNIFNGCFEKWNFSICTKMTFIFKDFLQNYMGEYHYVLDQSYNNLEFQVLNYIRREIVCNYRMSFITINSLKQKFLSYENQSIDLQSKSIDWFLYDGKFCV